MIHNRKLKQIWVAIKVERGFISDAKVYESFNSAKRTELRWRSRCNPDYDETAVIKTSFAACRSSRNQRSSSSQTNRKPNSKPPERNRVRNGT